MSFFEAVPTAAGLNRVPSNPFKLLDFSNLILADGETYEAATATARCWPCCSAARDVQVDGQTFANVGGRPNVFSGKPHSVYIPCGTTYSVAAHGRLEVGLVSAPSDLKTAPYVVGRTRSRPACGVRRTSRALPPDSHAGRTA